MSPEPVTAERVYARLKAEIMAGRYSPGAVLVTYLIADEFGTSISPVRDGMQRLIGERLLQAHVGGGYQIPEISVGALRELYQWHMQLLTLALRNRPSEVTAVLLPGEGETFESKSPLILAAVAAELFQRIGDLSGNEEHVRAIVSAGERLHAVRIREARVLDDVNRELLDLRSATRSGPVRRIRDEILAYHRRRTRRVERIVAEMILGQDGETRR